jgi:hypothetical protein
MDGVDPRRRRLARAEKEAKGEDDEQGEGQRAPDRPREPVAQRVEPGARGWGAFRRRRQRRRLLRASCPFANRLAQAPLQGRRRLDRRYQRRQLAATMV